MIKTKINAEGKTKYLIETASEIKSEWNEEHNTYMLELELDELEALYFELKEVKCQ